MYKFIEFLRKRPSDKTIRIWRIIAWLIIILLLSINFNEYRFNLPLALKSNELYFKYALFILWLVPIFMWATNICLAKRKYVKMIQILFWIMLIIVWNNIYFEKAVENTKPETSQSWSVSLSDLTADKKKSEPINIWFYIALLWIIPIIAWISGKCITSWCLKYKEVITKIRV